MQSSSGRREARGADRCDGAAKEHRIPPGEVRGDGRALARIRELDRLQQIRHVPTAGVRCTFGDRFVQHKARVSTLRAQLCVRACVRVGANCVVR